MEYSIENTNLKIDQRGQHLGSMTVFISAIMLHHFAPVYISLGVIFLILVTFISETALKVHMSEETKLILDMHERFLIQHRGAIDVKVCRTHTFTHAR